MAKIGTMTLTGQSGTKYSFNVYGKDTNFSDGVAGIYYISKRTQKPGGNHAAVYIGQAEDIKDRLSGHENQGCFDRNGYNAISIHREGNGTVRLRKESDLIDALDPPCNQA